MMNQIWTPVPHKLENPWPCSPLKCCWNCEMKFGLIYADTFITGEIWINFSPLSFYLVVYCWYIVVGCGKIAHIIGPWNILQVVFGFLECFLFRCGILVVHYKILQHLISLNGQIHLDAHSIYDKVWLFGLFLYLYFKNIFSYFVST